MWRIVVPALVLLVLSTAVNAQSGDRPTPRHPLSEGIPIDQIIPPKTGGVRRVQAPVQSPAVSPKEPVEHCSRQPTQPPRLQPTDRPSAPELLPPSPPIRTAPPKQAPPIGTIDPRPGTIRTFPGTIEAK